MAARFARLPPISSSTWLPESASEWIDSPSIDDDPEKTYATNFITAMPRFAASAAMMALVPPEVLTDRSLRSRPGWAPRLSRTRAPGLSPGRAVCGALPQ